MEAVVTMAVLLARFHFDMVPGQEPGMTTGATIHTLNGLYMTVRARQPPGTLHTQLVEQLQRQSAAATIQT